MNERLGGLYEYQLMAKGYPGQAAFEVLRFTLPMWLAPSEVVCVASGTQEACWAAIRLMAGEK